MADERGEQAPLQVPLEIMQGAQLPGISVDHFAMSAWPDGSGVRVVLFETVGPGLRVPRGCVAMNWTAFAALVQAGSAVQVAAHQQLTAMGMPAASPAKH